MVLLLDVETTGLDFENDRVIEFAMMVTSDDFRHKVDEFSVFVYGDEYPKISPEITKLTGIKPEYMEHAYPFDVVVEKLDLFCAKHKPQAIVAYNAGFDSKMLKREYERRGLPILDDPWLCAMNDVESNRDFKCKRLSHLALDRGLIVDPSTLHRALGDVELMRRVLGAAGATVDSLKAYRAVPEVYIVANVAHPREGVKAEQQRAIAKTCGFSWEQARGDNDGPRFDKRWVKKIKQSDWETEVAACPLKLSVI